MGLSGEEALILAKKGEIKTRIRLAQFEDEQVIKKNKYVYGRDPVYTGNTALAGNNYGWAFVSHPSCLAVANVSGEFGETRIGINKIFEKGNYDGDSGCILIEGMDFGYPYLNKPRDSNPLRGSWYTANGYPLPIYTNTTDAGNYEQTAAKVTTFAWNGVIYIVVQTQRQHSGVKLNGHILPAEGYNICQGTVPTVDGHDLVSIYEPNSKHSFVCGAAPLEAIAINANAGMGVESPLVTKKDPIHGAATYFCLGDNNTFIDKAGEIVFCISTGREDLDVVKQRVADALNTSWREAFAECKEYWLSVFSGLREKWLNVPAELRVKGYISIGLILSCCKETASGMFMGAGPGTWYGNFIRDTSFVIKALSPSKPEIAAELLKFFVYSGQIYGNNSFTIDGVPRSGHNTDNAPTFLLAVGTYFKETGDVQLMQLLKNQIVSALLFLLEEGGNHWNPQDGHIEAIHPHDFGDDGDDFFIMDDTKYESMIDILWIAGLEAIATVFIALDEEGYANYCNDVATLLRVHLDDFIIQSGEYAGMMAHSIKKDDTLADQAMWAATFIYGAWLLDREDCFEWCRKSAAVLKPKGSTINYCTALANSVETAGVIHGWGPYYPLIAALAYKQGDFQPLTELMTFFPSGAFPEFLVQNHNSSGKASNHTHCQNFPWAHASVLELVNALAE